MKNPANGCFHVLAYCTIRMKNKNDEKKRSVYPYLHFGIRLKLN